MMTKGARLPKILLLASTGYAVLNLLHWPLGFTFFTQLSNLYLAAVVLLQLLQAKLRALPALKFGALVSIFVTFFVYLTLLGPVMPGGLAAAYLQDHGASFCLHLLTPALAFWDFFWNDALYPYRKRHVFLALLPPLAYFLFILLLGQLGVRWRGDMTAPYPFLNYNSRAGWFGFLSEGGSVWQLQIGTFYAVLALLALFCAVAGVQFLLAQRRRNRAAVREIDYH